MKCAPRLKAIFTSLAGGLLLDSALGSGRSPDLLLHLSTGVTTARAGVVVDLVPSCGIVAELFGASAPTAVFLPLLGFELVIGVWLVTHGIREERQPTIV